MILNFYKYDLQITNNPNYDKDISNIQVGTMEMLNYLRRDGVHHITNNCHTGQDTYYLIHEHGIVANFISPFGKDN
jgi:hypothetical protein